MGGFPKNVKHPSNNYFKILNPEPIFHFAKFTISIINFSDDLYQSLDFNIKDNAQKQNVENNKECYNSLIFIKTSYIGDKTD